MKKVIVAGSRGFSNRDFVFDVLNRLYGDQNITIVSGGASGADSYGEEWARTFNRNVVLFMPDYKIHKKHKKLAPLIRNGEMAEAGDALVLFWDGRSRGSRDMLEKAYRAGIKEIHIYR